MEYYVKSVVPIIESNYDNFTNVERTIADFFIKNQERADFSSKVMAESLIERNQPAMDHTRMALNASLQHLNLGNVISPQFPILVMLDVIYSYYVEQDKFARETWHDDTVQALRQRTLKK